MALHRAEEHVHQHVRVRGELDHAVGWLGGLRQRAVHQLDRDAQVVDGVVAFCDASNLVRSQVSCRRRRHGASGHLSPSDDTSRWSFLRTDVVLNRYAS